MKKLFILSILASFVSPVFASDCGQKQLANTYQYDLKPITVYTGKTVTVKKHYDVYQPKVVYEKVNSYTTTKTCVKCSK